MQDPTCFQHATANLPLRVTLDSLAHGESTNTLHEPCAQGRLDPRGPRSARLHPIVPFLEDPHSIFCFSLARCRVDFLDIGPFPSEISALSRRKKHRELHVPGKCRELRRGSWWCGAQTMRSTNYRDPKIWCSATNLSASEAERCLSHIRMTGPKCGPSMMLRRGSGPSSFLTEELWILVLVEPFRVPLSY